MSDSKSIMNQLKMSDEEIKEFLSKPKLARLATIDDNKPHLAPVWYLFEEGKIFVTTMKGSKKVRNIEKNPNISIIIDECYGKIGDLSYYTDANAVIIEGKAELKDDTDAKIFKKIFELYIGKENLNNPMVQYIMNLPHVTITIKPEKIKSWDFRKALEQ